MRFTLGITTKYIDHNPTASMTKIPTEYSNAAKRKNAKLKNVRRGLKLW
jgi:hypothetical protein